MTPDEVKGAVAQADTKVSVPLSALTGVGDLFASFFPDGPFTVDPVTVRTETDSGVSVTGTGASGPFTGMNVTAVFTAQPDGVSVNVTATGDTSWTFATAFPVFGHTIFSTLSFQSPTLTLDSTADAMMFDGTLNISTPLAPLDLLMTGVEHVISGAITMISGPADLGFPTTPVPNVTLLGPAKASVDLGLFTLSGLSYLIGSQPYFSTYRIDWAVRPVLVIGASIPVTVGGAKQDMQITAEIYDWQNPLTFTGDFSALGDLALTEVAAFAMRQQNLPVPFDLSVRSPVRITDVQVVVNPAKLSVDAISVKVQTQETWTIVPNLLTLDAVDLQFSISQPLSSPTVNGILSGLFGIGRSGTLELSADFGARAIYGGLREDDGPLSIQEVYSTFTGVTPAPVPNLVVRKFFLALTLPTKTAGATFQAQVEVNGDWELIAGKLALTDIYFAIKRDTAITFQAIAVFSIAGVDLKITAGYDPAPDRKWEFSGETGPGQQIQIGRLFADLAASTGQITLPAPIAKLVLLDLGVKVATGNARLYLTATAQFPIDTVLVAIKLSIDTAQRRLDAALTVTVPTPRGPFTPTLAVTFAADSTTNIFVAVYTRGQNDPFPTVKDLVAAISPTAAAYVPEGITVSLRDAFAAVVGSVVLFGLDLTATIDLSKLPVIGERLGLGTVGFDPLRFVAISGNLPAAQVTALDKLLPAVVTKLPDQQDVTARFLIDGVLKLGRLERSLRLPVGEGSKTPAPTSSTDVQTGDNALWYKVQRTFGPITISRIGVAYQRAPGQGAQLAFLLDASLSIAGLTLSARGLQAGLALSNPQAGPTFDLAGLGIQFVGGPISISGAFLKSQVKYRGASYTSYSGLLAIKTPTLMIGALGSYMQLPQGPSLFAYAFLDYPAGIGPIFLRLRGAAAGFGYNRRLIPPPIGELADFPVVADAISGPPAGVDLPGQLDRLNTYLVPSVGDIFLMFGLHANSFKMVDVFLLLALAAGPGRFELHAMGLATLVLPAEDVAQPGVTPIAEVQIAVLGSFCPADGYFAVYAELTRNSFLLSRDCHLTGGFAFVSWFGGSPHAGDFVISVGGYHPHFKVPAHYPAVPRLGFRWQVTPQLQLSGGAYFALTPSALMAGGFLSATWTSGGLRVWFEASADFLIGWQPFHYEISLHVSFGVSYTFNLFGTHTIEVQVGADLDIWGPDFSGRASIHLFVISFSIAFGADANPKPQPLDWARFQATSLPPADRVATISLAAGSQAAGKENDLGVVDPHNLVLITDSAIPASTSARGPAANTTALDAGKAFGVGPMGVAATTASHRIEIAQGTRRADQLFSFEPVRKAMPYALWGGELVPKITAPQLTGELLAGYKLRPLPPAEPAVTAVLPDSALRRLTPLFTEHKAFGFSPPPRYGRSADNDTARAAVIGRGLTDPAVAAVRSGIVAAALNGAVIDLAGFDAFQFLQTPQVATRA